MRIKSLIVFFLFACTWSEAQIALGVKTGMNFSTLNTETSDTDRRMRLATHVGITSLFGLPCIHKRLSLQPDLLYSSQGSMFNYETEGTDPTFGRYTVEGDAMVRTNFINLNLPLRFTGGLENFGYYFLLGPYVGYWASGNYDLSANMSAGFFNFPFNQSQRFDLTENDHSRWDYGVCTGLGLRFPAGPGDFQIEVRYNHGFVNNIDFAIPAVDGVFGGMNFRESSANRVLAASVAYLIHLK
ncbi:MAG: outer membrane beta-barrel protein [Cytophagaceae bacterium]